MKKYAGKFLSAFLIAGILIALTSYFNEKMDNVVRTIAINNSNNVAAGSCTASGTGSTYYVTATSLNVRSGAGTDNGVVGSLSKCTQVKVYCQTNNWGRIAISSDKYVSMDYLSTSSSGCSSTITTEKPAVSFSVGSLSTNPSTIYYTNDFTASFSITSIKNVGSNETNLIGISIVNSAGSDVSSNFNIDKNYNFSNKSMAVTITNKNNTVPDNYTVRITGGSGTVTRSFRVNKKEFYFDLSLGNNKTPSEDQENTWEFNLENLIPDDLNMNDFDIQIVNSSGEDKTGSFNISKDGKTAYITNKRRIIADWEDIVDNYAEEGTYTVKVILANSSEYSDSRVSNYTRTKQIKIKELNQILEENLNARQNTRYSIKYAREDYDIDIIGTRNESGNTYYIVKENDIKNNTSEINEYMKQELMETYPNLKVNNITTEARYNNQVSVRFNNINVVNYNKSKELITYYNGSSTPIVKSREDFENEYPTAYGALTSSDYSFATNGDVQYHNSGIGTKITKKIEIQGPYQPLAVTGGEIKMTINYDNFTKSAMKQVSASMKKEGDNTKIIENATDESTGIIRDANFSLLVDKETGKDKKEIYLTIIFNGSSDSYVGNYIISLKVGKKTADIYFNLQNAPVDYYVYSEYDSHDMDDDALPAKVQPYSNRNYEYYIGVYMQKAKMDITSIEKSSIGFRVFDHRVDIDKDGNEYFFDEIEYVVKITRIAEGKVYYSLSLDNGATYKNNLSLSIADFAANYEEAYEYIKDYTAGKTKLKYYNLDENGNIISDNFPMHIIRTYKLKDEDLDMYVEYTTDASSKVQTILMNDDFKHKNSDMYSLIATRFSYDSNNRYILGAIRGVHAVKTDNDGNPIVGHEVSDQFYVQVNNSDDPKNTVVILPKTEVAPGSYYIYLTHSGSQGVGYKFIDDSPDAAIDKDIYPELWNRNIHMTEFIYSNPLYDVTFEEPKVSNSANDYASAHTNVESYVDLDFTLNYIYDLTNFSYRIEYNNNGKWIDANDYFDITGEFNPTLESEELNQNVLSKSNIHLTTKVGTTKQGTYRVVMTYENNGYKMVDQIQTFEISGNYYGININNDYNNNFFFYHNFAATIKIPVEGYSISNINAFQLKIAYTPDETTKIYYNWNSKNGTFTDDTGKVHFTYTTEVKEIDEENLVYTINLRNYTEKDHSPIDLPLGKYAFEVIYQEDNGAIAETSTTFEVKEDTHNLVIENEYPYANETDMGIKTDIEAQFIPYDNLDDDITYTVFYFDMNQGRYIDVSHEEAETRMFTITDTWEEKDRALESESYFGNVFLHINQNRIDLDGTYYLAAYYQEDLLEEFEITNLRDLFSWSIQENKVHGFYEIDGIEYEAEGFYNNIPDSYIDAILDTVHTNNAKYIITQDCGGFTCSPTLSTNYNNRFDLIEQDATHIKLKYKDDLPNNMKLEPGDYQLVVYYGENDYKISDFEIRTEYVNISISDAAIRTKIGYDRYVANAMFSNKDSSISVAARVFGVDYNKVNIKLTNPDQSVNYEKYFIIDRDNFYDSHILEIEYKASSAIPSGDYLLMIYYTDSDNKIVEDHVNLTVSPIYYNFELTGVSYDPNPAVPNYEDGGNIIVDVETDDLLNKTANENEVIRNQLINNTSITNAEGEDVTNLFAKSYISTNLESNFKLNLKYEGNTLEIGEYTVTMTYTLQGYTITKNINFQVGDYERSITITGVDIKSNTPDGKMHNNHGGSYIVNYQSNYQIFTNDLNVTVTSATNEDITNKFVITKNEGNVEVKYIPSDPEIIPGTYTISLIYTDPQTNKASTKTTEVRMYGNYKEVVIKDIKPNVTPIIAENDNQYYTFNLVTSNLTSEELANLKTRVYDSYGNIVYSNIPTDKAPNWFNTTKVSDEEYQVNILPYKARVGNYYVAVCLSDGYDDYYESNRLELTVDDTLYKVDLWGKDINPLERINNTDNIYDYIGVDGTYQFTTTHPEDSAKYSIKVFKNGALAKEVNIDPDYVDAYRESKFQIDDLGVNGEIEFALCINGLPYASATTNVLEYIKVTNVAIVLDYQDVKDSISINSGETKTFELVIEPANATNKNLIFTSANSEVATFDGNKVTIVGSGSTKVTLANKEYSKQFTINVNDQIMSSAYEVDNTNKTIYVKKMTTKSINKTTFINNLQNVDPNYKLYDKNNTEITSPVGLVGTSYKLVSGGVSYTIIVKGDTNCDGTIDMNDVTTIFRIYRNKVSADAFISKAADIDQDSSIGFNDATNLFRFYQGRVNEI